MKSAIRKPVLVASAALFLGGCATLGDADPTPAIVADVDTFTPVTAEVASLNQKFGAKHVLIVSDIDNTLLTSSSDLGGDIWYQWQRGKLDIKPTKAQQVSCLFEDTIGLLYELNPMTLTEPSLPEVIAGWQLSGNTVIALTSRDPRYRAATERELKSHGIDLTKSPLTLDDGSAPLYREKLQRELSYSAGIMMTTGMNKGEMLHWILKQTDREFDAVVFIDDSQSNIDDMYEAWKGGETAMRIFYYRGVEEARIAQYGSVLTQQQADKMAADYDTLNATLHQVFPARPVEHCLSIN